MSRPATFRCAWCETEKTLARTGRMPRFCSDWCRRQPEAAQRQLEQARWQLESATRAIAFYEDKLRRYANAGAAETNPPAAVDGNDSREAIAAERRTA